MATPRLKTKYSVLLSFGGQDGKTYRAGETVELDDKEAKYLHKHKAIGLYIGDDDEAPEVVLPKPRRAKPASVKKLDDSELLTPDPRAK